MDQIVGFNIHRGCLALARRPPLVTLAPDSLRAVRRVVVLEGVNNPDNVGGMFRSAAAFGIDLIVLGPGCGDPLYRKAIRTSMAATLDVPYVSSGPWPDALRTLSAAGLRILALTPASDAPPLRSMAIDQRVALLVGTEGAGLTLDAVANADMRVRIPMTGRVDSLNVTVAASIAMHHFMA
jgi:tRNA G18 (ribose-2'-O)-methylase SpoU